MLSDYMKDVIIRTAIQEHKKKLQKKLEKEKIKLDKCVDNSMHLPARQGIRGGQNTKLMARLSSQTDTVNKLKEQIEFLDKAQYLVKYIGKE